MIFEDVRDIMNQAHKYEHQQMRNTFVVAMLRSVTDEGKLQ